jgi:effector-binding domain-containing protein
MPRRPRDLRRSLTDSQRGAVDSDPSGGEATMLCSRRTILALAAALAASVAPVFGQPATPAPPKSADQPADPFGEEVTLPEKNVIYFNGTGNWDSAFETIVDAFKTVNAFLAKQGIKPDGSSMTIYTSTDDTSFQFQAAVPVAELPADPPKGDIAAGKSPSGRAFKFVHRGSYDAMDSTYEAITNYLDDKQLEAKDLFIEEYVTDPVTTPEDKLIVNIYVPIK